MDSFTEKFKALGDPVRLRITALLIDGELSVNEITGILGMGQSRISRHLKILTDCGILIMRRDGLWAFYSAACSGPGGEFLSALTFIFDGKDLLADRGRADAVRKERAKMTAAFFDSVASDWDDLKKGAIGAIDLNREISVRLNGSAVIADLGCGNGDLAIHLMDNGYTVIGVDSSKKMIDAAGKKAASRGFSPDFRIGQLEHLPLRDGEADAAVLSMVLHHVVYPAEVIQEVSRVVHSGGSIVAADYDAHTVEAMREKHHDRRLGFSKKDFTALFTEAGFTVEDIRTVRRGGLAVHIVKAYKK